MFTLFKKHTEEVYTEDGIETSWCLESGLLLEISPVKEQEIGLATALMELHKSADIAEDLTLSFNKRRELLQYKEEELARRAYLDSLEEGRFVSRQEGIFIKDPTKGFDLAFDFE